MPKKNKKNAEKYSFSAVKPGEPDSANQDACLPYDGKKFAVADGAGGSGVFAKEWADYLIAKLPENPFEGAAGLNDWLGSIWEDFYNEKEKTLPGTYPEVATKFAAEGSCSTLVVAWKQGDTLHWAACGDSVLFCYDKTNKKLFHSSNISGLCDFAKNPLLLNWKEEDYPETAYHEGKFEIQADRMFFACSDALSIYLLSAWHYTNPGGEGDDRETAKALPSRLGQYMLGWENHPEMPTDFEKDCLFPLLKAENWPSRLYDLQESGLILYDDYSLAGVRFE